MFGNRIYLLCILDFYYYLFYIYINTLRTVHSDKHVSLCFLVSFWII